MDHHFFPTPFRFARAIAGLVQLTPQTVLDPGAGTGVFGRVCRERWEDAFITGVELREVDPLPYYNHWITGDFRSVQLGQKYDLIIGNPPFKYAEDFIRRGMQLLFTHGEMIFLLRLNVIAGYWRSIGLWRDMPPMIVHVFPTRPSFTLELNGHNATDVKTEYAAFHWRKGYKGDPIIRWVKNYA